MSKISSNHERDQTFHPVNNFTEQLQYYLKEGNEF